MIIDAALIIRVAIFEVVGDATNDRELVSRLRVELCVSAARIERPVIETDVGQTTDLVSAQRYAAHRIGEPVAVAAIPLERRERIEVGATFDGVGATDEIRQVLHRRLQAKAEDHAQHAHLQGEYDELLQVHGRTRRSIHPSAINEPSLISVLLPETSPAARHFHGR